MGRILLQVGCGVVAGAAIIGVPILVGAPNVFDALWLYYIPVMFVAGFLVAMICPENIKVVPTSIVFGECLNVSGWGNALWAFFILHFAAVPAFVGTIAAAAVTQVLIPYLAERRVQGIKKP